MYYKSFPCLKNQLDYYSVARSHPRWTTSCTPSFFLFFLYYGLQCLFWYHTTLKKHIYLYIYSCIRDNACKANCFLYHWIHKAMIFVFISQTIKLLFIIMVNVLWGQVASLMPKMNSLTKLKCSSWKEKWIHTFPKIISVKWLARLVQGGPTGDRPMNRDQSKSGI